MILPRDSVKDCRILNAISALGAELVVQSKKIDDTSTYSDPIRGISDLSGHRGISKDAVSRVTLRMSAYDTKATSAEHDRMPAFGKKGLGTFGVSYHETFDFFWIKGPLRCKANNFFGYDLE